MIKIIKSFKHSIEDLRDRDIAINTFSLDNKVFATQTNIVDDNIILTTLFYESKTK